MAQDKETAARAEDVQKERQARITKLIKTLEAGADKDDARYRNVEKLDKERVKLAKKEEKHEDLGKKLWKSTFGGLFGGMTGAIPEPVKILGRMVGVAFGAKGRIRKKKKKLLQKAYKRAAAIGLDTAGWEEKTPESLDEIVENAELLHEIKMPDEPKAKAPAAEEKSREQNKLDPKAFLLTSKTQPLYDDEETAGVGMAPVSAPAEGGEGAFGSGLGGLSAAAEKAIIDLSEAGLKEGSIFVHDDLIFQANQRWQEEQEKRTDTPAQKKETRMDAAADRKKSQKNWDTLFKLMKGGGGGGGAGGGKEGGGKMAGLMKGILNPVTAASMLAAVTLIGNPASIALFLGAGAAIGGFFGAIIAALGIGIAVLGASLIALGAGLSALAKGMKDIPDALKGFEEVDGEKLAQAVTGMDGLFLALVGFGVGGWISKLADTEKLEAIPVVLKEFETIDGPALTKAGKGMKELAGGLAAMGVASVISAVGSFVSGGLSKLGELIGIKGPIAMLEEFSAVEIDSAKVKLNAEAMVTFGEAMAAAPVVNSTVVGGLFGAIVSAFGGTVEHPWDQVKKFGEIKFDTAQIKLNAEALAAFGTAMENLPAKVEGERVGGLFGAVADFFAGDVEMPWAQVKAFSEADLGDTAKVIANTSALVAFATAMENMPVKIEGTREGGVFGAIAGFFTGDVKMPWDQIQKFANADLGDLDKIKANTEKLVAFSEAMAYMPPDMEDPVIALPDFAEILNNIKAKFTGSIAAILSKIPTWLLPKKAEEWLAANKAATEAAAAPDVSPAPTPKADVVTEDAAPDAVTSGVVGDAGQQKPTQQEAMEAIIAERSKLTGPGSDTEYYRLSDEFEKLQSMTPEEFDAQTPDSAVAASATTATIDTAEIEKIQKQISKYKRSLAGIRTGRTERAKKISQKNRELYAGLIAQKQAELDEAMGITPLPAAATEPTTTGLEPSPVTEKLQKDIPTVPQAAVTPSISDEKSGAFTGYGTTTAGMSASADLKEFMGSKDISATHKAVPLEQGGGFKEVDDDEEEAEMHPDEEDAQWQIDRLLDKTIKTASGVKRARLKLHEYLKQGWGVGSPRIADVTNIVGFNPNEVQRAKMVRAAIESGILSPEVLPQWSGMTMQAGDKTYTAEDLGVVGASKGLVGFVKQPTLILAGESGAESVDIRPTTLAQHSSSLTPAPGAGGGTMIVNAPDNSSIVSTSTNNQMSQDPGWAVFHTPVYARGSYAR